MTIAGIRYQVISETLVTSYDSKGKELRYVAVRVVSVR